MVFAHQKVDTVCIKEFPTSVIQLGRRVGPFKLGNPYKLEYYIARIFVEQGFLKFDEKNLINSMAIQKINFMESTNQEPRQIDDMIYVQSIQQLSLLDYLLKADKVPRRDFSQLYSDVNDLIRVRLAKIVRLATQPQLLKTRNLLTEEERILFDQLSHLIQEWQDYVPSKFKKKNGNI
jgi:hypothetical protein